MSNEARSIRQLEMEIAREIIEASGEIVDFRDELLTRPMHCFDWFGDDAVNAAADLEVFGLTFRVLRKAREDGDDMTEAASGVYRRVLDQVVRSAANPPSFSGTMHRVADGAKNAAWGRLASLLTRRSFDGEPEWEDGAARDQEQYEYLVERAEEIVLEGPKAGA